MHLRFKGCATASTWYSLWRLSIPTINRTGIKGDFSGLVSHRNYVFMVHHKTGCGVAAEENLEDKNNKMYSDILQRPGRTYSFVS